jgi:hypothetical protein
MKAISLSRPGPQAIIDGTCRLINRHFPPPDEIVGQYVALHATRNYKKRLYKSMKEKGFQPPTDGMSDTGIVGIGCVSPHTITSSSSSWYEGPYGWLLEDVKAIRYPILISGSPGLWDVPRNIVDMLRNRWHDTVPGILECTDRKGLFDVPTPSIYETPILVVNVHTSGLRRVDRIICFSANEYTRGRLTDSCFDYVNIGRDIPESVTRTNGISNKLLSNKRNIFPHKLNISKRFNRARYILCHNAPFHLGTLIKEIKPTEWNRNSVVIDTKKIAKDKNLPVSFDGLMKALMTSPSGWLGNIAADKGYNIYQMALLMTQGEPIVPEVPLGTIIDQAIIRNGGKI